MTSFLEAINASKNDVPTPSFGKVDEALQKEALKKLDIKSFSVLNKKPTLSAAITLEGDIIKLKPLSIDRSKGFGHEDSDESIVSVHLNASNQEIYDAIIATFDKCM